MKEEDLTTGPAIATDTNMVDAEPAETQAVGSRKILIDVRDDGGLSLDLSDPFKLYEVYGILATTFIDMYVKNTLLPILSESQEILAQHTLNIGNQLAALITRNAQTQQSEATVVMDSAEQEQPKPQEDSALIAAIKELIEQRHG